MVVIHCTVDVVTLNSRISAGNSTVITVSVRMPMKARDPTATIEPMSRPLIFSSAVLLDAAALVAAFAPFVVFVFAVFVAFVAFAFVFVVILLSFFVSVIFVFVFFVFSLIFSFVVSLRPALRSAVEAISRDSLLC